MSKIERTFFIIKPDGLKHQDRILDIFRMKGFSIAILKEQGGFWRN